MAFGKQLLLILGIILVSSASSVAEANVPEMHFFDKTCFRVAFIRSCKPTTKWDTQKKENEYKFVYHRRGPNPEMKLRFDYHPIGKTAYAYAKHLKTRYEQRGLTDVTVHNAVISGQKMSFISAYDPYKHFRYIVGVLRNKHTGVIWEGTAAAADFAKYEPQLRRFITQTRVLNQYSY